MPLPAVAPTPAQIQAAVLAPPAVPAHPDCIVISDSDDEYENEHNNGPVHLGDGSPSIVQCPVCLDMTKLHFKSAEDCGHVLCAECSVSFEFKNCPLCRHPYSYWKPVYINLQQSD